MSNWEWKKLGDVCDIINGRNQKEVVNPQGAYPICGSGGIMGYADKYLCRENTVIIGRKGSINNPIYVQEKFWNVDTAFGLQSKDNYLPKLLYYFCIGYDFSKHNKGTTIPSLVKSDLLEISVPVPPLAEQKRIVKTLDEKFAKIDKLKTAAETNLKNASEIFNAELNSKLNVENENLPQGWEIKTLQELSIQYGEYGMSVPSTSFDGVRYLRITDITDEGTLNEELVSADVDVIDDFYKLQEGDILFARTGATVGKTFVYEDKYGECVFAGYLIRYRPNQKLVMPRFLFYVTHSPKYFEWIRSNQKAAAQPNISAKLYNAFQIPLPPLSEQKRIVAHLDKLSEKVKRLEEIYRRTIDDCEELKKSILKQVFEVET